MGNAKHLKNNESVFTKVKNAKNKRFKLTLPAIIALFVVMFAVGGTVAYLMMHTTPVQNKFTPATVTCAVNETFDGTTKSNVTVQNTGDVPAYLRVRLVSYRVNNAGDRIGGTAAVPNFTLGENWVKNGDYYYYTLPVSAGESTVELINSITLISYNDADGGKQAIDVMAEAIQSEPAKAIGEAWGVTITQGNVATYAAGN